MATIADLLGLGGSITHEGKRYELRKPTLAEEARFSRRLEDRAKDAVLRDTKLSEEDADRLYRAVMRDIAAGYWEVDSAGYVEALRTPDGMGYMLYLVLSRDHPEVTEAVARRMIETGMREIAAALVREQTDDPKALSLVCQILGLPADFMTPASESSSASGSSASPTPPSAGPPTSSAA